MSVRYCWSKLRWYSLLCCFIWISLTITSSYLEVVVQCICTVWRTYCDFFRASVFVNHKQIWRETQEESFTKAFLILALRSFVLLPFLSSCAWMTKSSFCTSRDKRGSRDREGTKECFYSGDGLEDRKCREMCQRGQMKREGGKLERTAKTRYLTTYKTRNKTAYFLHLLFCPDFFCLLKRNVVCLRQCQFHSVCWTILNWEKPEEVSEIIPKSSTRD